jgi:hypothetical protein
LSTPWRHADVSSELRQRQPARWAKAYRVIGGQPFTIVPPLEQIYADRHPRLIVRKAAQVFVSEYLINMALWCADTRQGGRGNALCVFLQTSQLSDLSAARVQPAIDQSPYLLAR